MKVSGETLYQLAESAGYSVKGDGWWDLVWKGPGVEIYDLEIIPPGNQQLGAGLFVLNSHSDTRVEPSVVKGLCAITPSGLPYFGRSEIVRWGSCRHKREKDAPHCTVCAAFGRRTG